MEDENLVKKNRNRSIGGTKAQQSMKLREQAIGKKIYRRRRKNKKALRPESLQE